MDNNERDKLAFEYAKDTTKQLMTLATGFIALTVTFSKSFISNPPEYVIWQVTALWLLLLASVIFGQICLMSLTGILGSKRRPPLNIYNKTIKFTSIIQALTFFLGLGFGVSVAITTI
ncbi:hypothetical protein TW85_00200 [Marinomonas sp. S3726]|uniref:hypothetical protein n=1 Tax=Marinomonas sp. S3726 TaxID=579484 RepID=UPI0005FA3F57|nr:hypothetical protein [Marinomonas sp. S3726]KJZ16443.1 hypothetical protein TW85_00200 [Marinomonas sp. S3726]